MYDQDRKVHCSVDKKVTLQSPRVQCLEIQSAILYARKNIDCGVFWGFFFCWCVSVISLTFCYLGDKVAESGLSCLCFIF